MPKDFDKWNLEKKSIHSNQEFPFYNEREIWWCSLGVNVGFEQDGTGQKFDRPVLVIKGFNKNTFLCVGLTGKKKTGKYYFYLGKIEGRDSTAVLSQIRVIDTKRLIRKIETLEEKTFQELMESVKKTIFN
jgi:mRNA interferase MazF